MHKHQGETCRGCGTLLLSPEERESRVCDTCWAWQGVGGAAQPAINYARRQAADQKAERIERWRKRWDGRLANGQGKANA